MDSQRALDTARHEISARDEAYSTLSNAHQNLAEKFRVSQLKVTEHWQELARRRDVESELAAARAHLGAKTTDFAAHVSLAEDTLRALREKLDTANSQMTALHGTHAQLDREVSALRTRQATLDETLAQKQGHLDAREAELHALRKDIIVRDAELAAAAERAEQGREWERSQLAALQAELEALRSTDEDNRVLREVDAAREVELSALREDVGALREEVGTLQEEASTRETLAATREQESVTLRVLRQENGLLLQNLRTATTAAEASAEKLKETLKGRQKEIVQLKKKISQGEQSAAKTKAELLQLKEKVNALDRRCSEQDVTHTKLVQENQEARRQHHAERDELEEQIKATSDWAAAEYQVWLDENRRHQVKVMSLEETIKNLQASVLRAGAQAKQELRKTADDERHRLEDKVHARDEENDDLRYDLKGALRELKSLKKAFQEIESHRAELITEVNVSRTRVRSRTPDVYASSSREYIEPPSFEPHKYTPEIYFESEDNGIDMQEGGQWGYSVPDTPDPDPEAVKQERLSYRQFMRAFPYPQVRPPFKFDLLEPVQEIGTNPLHNFTHVS
ncbi:hypothetical protein C8R43DRAFT_242500 [Mycena crocata]|nr:hypothetical protein C8R43DRAFT_242500 [Mycena crocata]